MIITVVFMLFLQVFKFYPTILCRTVDYCINISTSSASTAGGGSGGTTDMSFSTDSTFLVRNDRTGTSISSIPV